MKIEMKILKKGLEVEISLMRVVHAFSKLL